MMINYISTILSPISIHYVGRQPESEGTRIKDEPTVIADDYIRELFLKYLLSGFKEPAFSCFTFSSGDETENPMFQYAEEIFEDRTQLHEHSKKIANYLYNHSKHPNIKDGDFIMCYFEDLLVEDEMLDAIGIFKAESTAAFLKLIEGNKLYELLGDEGLALNGLDKGCLILNTEKSSGYKICLLDKSNKSEAWFWSNEFLNVKERSDDYHFTSHYIQLTKDFVEEKKRTTDNFDKDKELAVMNASEKFFKSNENFKEEDYLEDVFETGLATEFTDFKRDAQRTSGFFAQPDFDISDAAVKKNNKVFKSVIKLDKDFHIYVHGDRSKIEKGVDDYGRKFYKIFYEEET